MVRGVWVWEREEGNVIQVAIRNMVHRAGERRLVVDQLSFDLISR